LRERLREAAHAGVGCHSMRLDPNMAGSQQAFGGFAEASQVSTVFRAVTCTSNFTSSRIRCSIVMVTTCIAQMPTPFPTAALGSEIEVPTLARRASFAMPESTQSGKTFRLCSKSIKGLHSSVARDLYVAGDLYLHAQVETPVKPTEQQRSAQTVRAHIDGSTRLCG
jgi:hypothetical protein